MNKKFFEIKRRTPGCACYFWTKLTKNKFISPSVRPSVRPSVCAYVPAD
jgi:hypothetical protein